MVQLVFYRYGDCDIELELFEEDGVTAINAESLADIKLEIVLCNTNEVLQSFSKSAGEIKTDENQNNKIKFIFDRKHNVKLGFIRIRYFIHINKVGYIDNKQVISFGTDQFAKIIE